MRKPTTNAKKNGSKSGKQKSDDGNKRKTKNEEEQPRRHKSKTLVKGTASFDERVRKDFCTGFRKRKNARRKVAAKQFEDKMKEKRNNPKMKKRMAFREALGLDREDDDAGDDDGDDGKNSLIEKKERRVYRSGVQVCIEEM
jgi:hypothetical protein